MSITVAELRAVITADDTQYQQRMNAVFTSFEKMRTAGQSSVSSVSAMFDQLGPSLLKAGAALTGLTAPFDLFIKAGTDINQKLVEIRNNTILSDQEADQMRQTILRLASESPAKIEDIGQAYFRLTNFGLRGAEATTALEAALQSAVGAGASVEKTAEALAIALHDFGLKASDASTVMGTLHNAAAAGNLTLEQMVSVTGRLFNAAGALGLKLPDTVGAFAALTRAGLPAAQASIALTTALTKIVNPTQQSAKELAILSKLTGVDLVSDFTLAGLQAKGLTGIIGDLAIATHGHEDAILKVVAAQRGGLALLGLTQRQTEDLIPILGNLAHVQGGELTPIQDGWNRAMAQTGNQLDTLKNKITVFAAQVTENLGAKMVPVFAGIGTAIDGVAAAWGRLTGPTQAAILAFGGVSAVAGPILIALGAIVTFLGGPLAAGLVAAVAAVAAFAAAYAADFDGLKTKIDQTLKDIVSFYNDHKAEIDLLAKAVVEGLGVILTAWVENAKLILDAISTITLALRVAEGDWSGAWKQIGDNAKREQERIVSDNSTFTKIIRDAFLFIQAQSKVIWDDIMSALEVTWQSIVRQAQNAWNAIADAVVGPIKRAYDFLKNLDWQSIFDGMTAAAKAGLQIHSPPIIAIWMTDISEATIKAAAQCADTVPVFDATFHGMSAAASRQLPGIAGLFVELGSTVVKILEGLKVKVPKIFDDIFGSVKGSGGSSGASKSAKDTGSELGNQLVEGFGDALKGVQGIAAGQKQGGILGRLEGVFSGALAGAQIGAMFGAPGAAIGAGIGAIAGFFLSAQTELQKAQAAAALQQAKDAVTLSQQSVLQAVEQTKQSWIDTLDKARTILESIAFYSKVPKLAFQQFFVDVNKLFDNLVELATKWKSAATADVKAAAENMSAGVALLAQLPAALDGISKYLGTPDASFDVFFAAAAKYFAKLEDFLSTIPKSVAKAVSKFSTWLKSGVDLLTPLTDGLKALLDLKDVPTDAQFALVDQAIDKIIANIGALGEKFDKGLLKQMAFFADKAGSAIALVKDTVDAIKAVVGTPMLTDADANNLVNGLTMFITKLSAGLSALDTEQLTRVSSIASTILPIAAAIKAWADTSAAIRGYTVIASDTWDAIVADFQKAIELMGVLIDQATQFETMAIALEAKLKSGAQHLTDGIAAMVAGVTATASALQAAFGQIQGGTPPGTVVGATSFTGGSSSTTTVHLTIHGSDPKAQKILKAVGELLGGDTGLSAVIRQYS